MGYGDEPEPGLPAKPIEYSAVELAAGAVRSRCSSLRVAGERVFCDKMGREMTSTDLSFNGCLNPQLRYLCGAPD